MVVLLAHSWGSEGGEALFPLPKTLTEPWRRLWAGETLSWIHESCQHLSRQSLSQRLFMPPSEDVRPRTYKILFIAFLGP